MIDCHVAANHHYASALAAYPIGESIDECEMSDVLDDRLKLDTVTPLEGGEIPKFRIHDDGIQRTREVAYRIRRGIDRVEIFKVAGDRRRPGARRIARFQRIVQRLRDADDMRAVVNERLHGFESNAAAASGHDHSLAGQIDAG